jgi:hypothetical protein
VGIMAVIVGALYGMFHFTQKALRANVTQVDVLADGRAAMEQLARELGLIAATRVQGGTNFTAQPSPVYEPVIQPLMAGAGMRTNVLDETFFMSRYDREYSGTTYRVLYAKNGVGALGKFSGTWPVLGADPTTLALFATGVVGQDPTNYVTLADGVIHFRVLAYDPSGFPLVYNRTNISPAYRVHRVNASGAVLQTTANSNVVLRGLPTGETRCVFLSNALPAYVEVELGLLEPKTYEQFKAFQAGSPLAQRFLADHAAQVHLFRQRVPIRQALLLQPVHP